MGETPMWRRYVRFWGADPEADALEEVRFHFEMKEQELMRGGLTPAEARRAAERAFGDRRSIEAQLRRVGRRRAQRARRASVVDELRSDLRYTWRTIARRPGVPALVVLMLALGIGASTAVFSLFQAVLINPLAVERPEELYAVYEGDPGARTGLGFAYPMILHLSEHATGVDGVAGFFPVSVGVRTGEHAEQARAAFVTGSYFDVLGVGTQRGRTLQQEDETAAALHVVVSDGLWRRAFGSSPDIIGSTLIMNEVPVVVVGVAPLRFRGTDLAAPVDVWLPITSLPTVGRNPLHSAQALETWFFTVIDVLVRIPASASPTAVLAQLTALHRAAMAEVPTPDYPFHEPRVTEVVGMPAVEAAAARGRADLIRLLTILLAVVAVGLAIACVNVANLMMMRATERRREITVRAAIGASRGRVLRQLMLENVVLALLAGVLGTAVGVLVMQLFGAFALPGGVAIAELRLPLDLRVLAFTAAVCLGCALAFGTAPALAASRTDVAGGLREATAGGRGGWRGGSVLVSVQVALSVVLLVAGFLFLRSLQTALAVDLGFRSDGVASVAVGLEQHGYDEARAEVFIAEVLAELAARPGIAAAAAASRVPIDPDATRLRITAVGAPPDAPRPAMPLVSVTPSYFEALGIPLVHGRGFDETDRPDAPLVVVVTEQAARQLWPGEDPIGRQLVPMFGGPYTVVGVVGDAHYTRLTEREPHIFFPVAQAKNFGAMARLRIIARGTDSRAALGAVRASVRAVDARLPTFEERDVSEQINRVLMPQRFGTFLLGAFGMLALIISAAGIYAVAGFDVARRRRELGIRAALGATRRDLSAAVLRRTAAASLLGVAAGLLAAAFATRGIDALLFGVEHREPASYIAAAVVLGGIALLASWPPARRAASVDPLSIMRQE